MCVNLDKDMEHETKRNAKCKQFKLLKKMWARKQTGAVPRAHQNNICFCISKMHKCEFGRLKTYKNITVERFATYP